MSKLWYRLSGLFTLLIWAIILFGIGWALHHEAKTSRVQSELFSKYAQNLFFTTEPARNRDLQYPADGPYDLRFGYSRLPQFLDNLESAGYEVESQPRLSQSLREFIQLGGFAIYNEKTSAGLQLYDRAGGSMYAVKYPTRIFDSYEDVPPLVAQTLLFIEDRNLLTERAPYRNPAVEWNRFLLAALGQIAKKINPGINLGGGSTLATQIEKFRHSPEGRTGDAKDKLRQMLTASVRAYRQGPETLSERKRIILDYLNSTPLTARVGIGEVNGIGDGLYAWYGTELAEAKAAFAHPATDAASYRRMAELYKQTLSLMLAERRPSYYLITNRTALNDLTNSYLDMLAQDGRINPALAALGKQLPLNFKMEDPTAAAPNWLTLKAANAVRLNLMKTLGLSSLYELDRTDVTARSTLDTVAQNSTIKLLQDIGTPEGAAAAGMVGFRLFKPTDDFSKVIYSAVLYEKTPYGNAVRVQADNLDKPLDLNEGAKLDLGSTAKLRTLASYLTFIGDLYDRYRGSDATTLATVIANASDNLTRFVAGALKENPQLTMTQLLDLAMARKYSANPGEVFFTGGGIHTFVNFEHWEDSGSPSVTDALANSVNLSFVRIMRDVVDYLIAQGPITRKQIFSDPDHPARQAYLARFADREGRVFLSRFYDDYHKLDAEAALQKLLARSKKTLAAQATVYRSVRSSADLATFSAFIRARQQAGIQPGKTLDAKDLATLYGNYGIDKYSLTDRGYIAGVNPLQLWLVDYLAKQPKATREQALQASVDERQQTYSWLFQTRFRGAQDTRIRILIEQDAFARLHEHWARLGYPFERLVPSLATAIGSSADRPGALADLMGIIVNDGVKLPTVRIEDMLFAKGTPYETPVRLKTGTDSKVIGSQVMRPEVAAHLRAALLGVVENGTAKRVAGVYKDETGLPLPVGGKTGTGDHRFKVFARGGGLVSSKAVARTATFVFYIGNRFYGTMTAHVEGEIADNYKFTSALSAQLLKALAPAIQQLVAQQPGDPTLPKKAKAGPESAGEAAIEETVAPATTGTPGASIKPNLPMNLHSDEPLPAAGDLPATANDTDVPEAAPAPLPAPVAAPNTVAQ